MSDEQSSFFEQARDLIRLLEGTTVRRVAIESGGNRVEVEREVGTVQHTPSTAPAGAAEEGPPAEADGRHAILAPLVGTFYRAPQPGAKPFVEEGDTIDAGQVVGIVEAMKLMNQVHADRAGRVAEISATDGEWVEFEQALMFLDVDEA
jgi:acetyl-CoA carboxylase biotin carboxyl carrier protein